ncbi:MAG: hypothetical protein H7287_02855 [Thermoleophilia bacterium]|nr:hypothetical protein [Thermoleophilia bacterium]
MRRPPRPSTPSAIDGYQRLRRGTSLVPPHAPGAAPTAMPESVERRDTGAARSWRRRIVGATRLAGLAAVLAVIVGASVGLASSDTTHPRSNRERAAMSSAAPAAAATPNIAGARAAAVEVVAQPIPSATAVADIAAPAANRALPFTGDRTAPTLLLGGAALVLLGMLLQIAGQPLPAARTAMRAAPAPR